MWVRILKNHDYWPTARRMVSYKAGVEQSVTAKIGGDLIAAGVAEEIPVPDADQAAEAKVTGKVTEKEAKAK